MEQTRLGKLETFAVLVAMPSRFVLIDAAEPIWEGSTHSRVQKFAERQSVLAGGPYARTHYSTRSVYVADWGPGCIGDQGKAATDAAGVFALRETRFDEEIRNAPAAFNFVESIGERDARAQKLFAELQNGVALGRETVQRLRHLEEMANEEGEPFSLDSLEALVMFANAHPSMPMPELTLGRSGGIIAEWRKPGLSLTMFFETPISVQYVVKKPNPRHRNLVERSSGTTTVDSLGEALQKVLSADIWRTKD